MSYLSSIGACTEGASWADSQPNYREAWDNCKRGDWMLWIAKKQSVDLKKLTLAKVECAEIVKHLMTDERSINALTVARKFCAGEASREELNAAAVAAAAADAAAYAAAAADYAAAARSDTLSKAADIVRRHIKFEELNIAG